MLLAKEDVTYKKAEKTATKSDWVAIINSALETVEKPSGLNCDKWRVPTLAEAEIFLVDKSAITITKNSSFFCIVEEGLGCVLVKLENDSQVIGLHSDSRGNEVKLRPVIDITY